VKVQSICLPNGKNVTWLFSKTRRKANNVMKHYDKTSIFTIQLVPNIFNVSKRTKEGSKISEANSSKLPTPCETEKHPL
jgi:hypothetical protein